MKNNTQDLIKYGMLGVAGYFLLKSYSGNTDAGSSMSGGNASGGASSFSSYSNAPILDSFNTSSVNNVSAPTYLTSTNYSVAPIGASTEAPSSKKASSVSTTSAPASLNPISIPSSPVATSPTLFNQYVTPSSSSIGGYSFTASGRGTMSSTPSPLVPVYSGSTSSGTSSSTTKKETTAPTTSTPVAWYNTTPVKVIAPVVSIIGNLFSGWSKKK